MVFREDTGTGYMYCHIAGHPCANKAGKVLEHVYVMTQAIGRPLTDEECVHHLDRDKKNNSLNNLQLLTRAIHTQLHGLERRPEGSKRIIWQNGSFLDEVTLEPIEFFRPRACLHCFQMFTPTVDRVHCCSVPCRSLYSRRFNPSKEELEIKVWELPTTQIAKLYGVSDVAVAKRCKLLGVAKPQRGYWAIQAGKALQEKYRTEGVTIS